MYQKLWYRLHTMYRIILPVGLDHIGSKLDHKKIMTKHGDRKLRTGNLRLEKTGKTG